MQLPQVFKPAAEEGAERADVMFLRHYEHGRLVKETVLRVKEYDLHRKELKRDQRARKDEKRQAARVSFPSRRAKIFVGCQAKKFPQPLQQSSSAASPRVSSRADEDFTLLGLGLTFGPQQSCTQPSVTGHAVIFPTSRGMPNFSPLSSWSCPSHSPSCFPFPR